MLDKIRSLFKKRIFRAVFGIIIGGVAGYLYYKLVGCRGGTCPITSNQYYTIAYGMFAGAILGLF